MLRLEILILTHLFSRLFIRGFQLGLANIKKKPPFPAPHRRWDNIEGSLCSKRFRLFTSGCEITSGQLSIFFIHPSLISSSSSAGSSFWRARSVCFTKGRSFFALLIFTFFSSLVEEREIPVWHRYMSMFLRATASSCLTDTLEGAVIVSFFNPPIPQP